MHRARVTENDVLAQIIALKDDARRISEPLGDDAAPLGSDRASRAMAYVGMTRARDENHLAIYPAVTNDAHQHTHGGDTVIHQTRRGTKHIATQHFRTILANGDRAHTMHTVAADTDPRLLPDIVAALVDRNERRRTQRARAWRREGAQIRPRQAACQRFATARQQAAARERSRTKNYRYEHEL